MNALSEELVQQRIEYLRAIRALHNGKRQIGFVLSLAGVLLLIWGTQRVGAPAFAEPLGLGLIAASWALFGYVIFMRNRYVRANPFKPKS
jgi:drug/metabolite transporter (DMT)-like permease